MTMTILATVAAIISLTELGKSFGITGRWSQLLAVVLGAGIGAIEYAAPMEFVGLTASGIYEAVAQGVVLGLGAAGLYDVAGRVGTKVVEQPVAADYDYAPQHAADYEDAEG